MAWFNFWKKRWINRIPDIEESSIPPMPPVKSPRRSEPANILSSPGFTWNLLLDIFDGEKYPGGLDPKLDFFYIDYWTLRRRSYRLFTENRYARGLINRLLTNEIHRGLILEATPVSQILNEDNDFLNDWSDDVESKFGVWAENKELVSYDQKRTFGQIQRDIRKTALLSGDVLVILRQHSVAGTPVIQLIDGSYVRTPIKKSDDYKIKHGVELDDKNRQIAYWVQDASDPMNMEYKRIPARGERTGRRISWLVYGDKIRIDDVRGMPALGVILQGLKELDRYSDAEQRSAVLNALMAFFIKKDKPGMGTKAFTGGAQRYDAVGQNDSSDGSVSREFNIASHLPGIVMDELAPGETPESFTAARPNVNYRAFEEAMMASFAWVREIPPNIFRLAFSSNYSASGGEINELRLYLDRIRSSFASDATKPVYREWLISMVLQDAIAAPGLLEAWRNKDRFLEFGAWSASEWSGAIKPSLRRGQDIKAYIEAINEGLATRDMACKEIWGRKFTTISRRLTRENDEYLKAIMPLLQAGLIKTYPIETED